MGVLEYAGVRLRLLLLLGGKVFRWVSHYSGSDPAKQLFLKRYGFKKEGFLRLEYTFWGQKVGFKDFAPCSWCWFGFGFLI